MSAIMGDMKDRIAREFWNRVDSKLNGATLKDLCDKAGLNYNSIRNRKSGDVYSLPRMESGYQIAKALGVSLEYLLTGETDRSYNARIRAIADALESDPEKLDAVEVLLFDKKVGQSLNVVKG